MKYLGFKPFSFDNRMTVSGLFKRSLCLFDQHVYIVVLPLTQQITQQLPQIIDWCNAHLHAKFDYAYLGAIEDVDGEYFLSGMVPESMPTGLFFAFACSDDELMFRLTWNGDVY